MTSLTVHLDEQAAERLRRRAVREGLDVADLAGRLLAEATEQDPLEFVGIVHSGQSNARNVDEFLDEHGFGAGRS